MNMFVKIFAYKTVMISTGMFNVKSYFSLKLSKFVQLKSIALHANVHNISWFAAKR